MAVYSLIDDQGKIIKEGLDISIEIYMNQLNAFSEMSEEPMKASDIKALTEITKTLAFLSKLLKEQSDDENDIMQMTADEIAREAEKILKSRVIK